MKRPLFLLLAAIGLVCGAAACTTNSGTADSPAGSNAAAADTAGAHASMRMDRTGVRMDSASTKPVE